MRGKNGAFASLFGGNKNKNIITPKLKADFDYFQNMFNNSSKSAEVLAEEIVGGVNPAIVNCAKGVKNGELTFKMFKDSIDNATLSAKAGQVALKGLSIALNMAAIWVISKVVSVVTEKLNEFVHASEIATKKAEGFTNSIKSSISDISSNVSTLSNLNDEYQKLSNGVNILGENISLSTDEYDRYKQIINQISDIMPNLVTYFNAQGEAIAFAKGNLNDLNKEYEKYIQAQAKEYLSNGDSEGNTIDDLLDDYNNNYEYGFWESVWKGIKNHIGIYDGSDIEPDILIKQLEGLKNKSQEEISDYLDKANGFWDYTNNTEDRRIRMTISKILGLGHKDDVSKMTGEEFNQLQEKISEQIELLQSGIDTDMSNIRKGLLITLYSKDTFWDIDDTDIRDNIATFISSIDNEVWKQITNGEPVTEMDLRTFVSKIIDGFAENKDGFADAWNGLFDPELLELPVSEYETKIQEFIDTIADYFGFDENGKKEFLISLGIDIGTGKLQNSIMQINSKVTSISDEGIETRVFDLEGIEELNDFTKEFTSKEVELWLEATQGARNATEAIEMYKKALKDAANETPNSPFTEAISQVESLSEGLDQLDKIYTDVYDKGDFDWSSMLNNDNFKEVFGDFTEEYNDFIETVANSPDDINACQTAFDRLATAFINDSDAMKNLSDETKETTIRMLEQKGIANAEEFVNQYLISSYGDLKNAAEELGIEKQRLSDLTQDEIEQLLNEESVSKETKDKLAGLYIAQLDLNKNPLDTSASIENLLGIVGASSEAATALVKLQKVMQKIEDLKNNKGKYEEGIDFVNETNSDFDKRAVSKINKNLESNLGVSVVDDLRNKVNSTQSAIDELEKEAASLREQASVSIGDFVSGKYGDGSDTKKAKENTGKSTSQTYDWIETAIKRIEQLISRLKSKADSAYKSWSSRNSNLKQEISAVRNEIDLQQQAYERYMQMAASVGLSESWASKVRNGQASIESIADENLADKIKEYQEWYEKALDCRDAMEELDETVKDLYKTAFDNISSRYDDILSAIEHQKSMLDESISQAEQSSYKSFDENHGNLLKSIGYYKELLKQEQTNVSQLIQERDALTRAFNEAMGNGIDQGSEAWAQMRDKINDVTLAIEKSNTTVLGYHDSISKLFETAFENIESMYDNILSFIENRKNLLDASISQTEEKGWLVSAEYYKALMEAETENLTQLEKERAALLSALNDAVANGVIKEYTQAWYDMKDRIDDVTVSIEEANTAVIRYGNSIRDIEWSIFDLLNDRISNITSEADFLIDLMESDKLYDEDTGKLTDEGMATMGLHGVDYNIYMAQADEYAEEILKIDRQLAEDPYNQELLDRRQELLEQQQEMILAAESEKQAIKDMVEEGIKLELDALKELIDTYTDALDSQKDLYDYQKKVSRQTKEIASLQKQLSAYENDLSEETRAKVQQIRVSLETAKEDLEEMEYEKYIADQKKLLDDLYLEYELILNQRLDNLDALIGDMIGQINSSADIISTTLSEKAESVGYTLSDSMASIWDTSTGDITSVITKYGEDFLYATTKVNETLRSVNTNLQNMIAQLNAIADMKIQSVSANTNVNTPSPNGGGSSGGGASNQTGSASSQPSSAASQNNSSWGSWFISKKDSYAKNKLNIDTSIVDRLKYHDFDSSKEARAKYFAAMGGSGNYTGSATQNEWMLKELKAHGYAKGGYVADLQRIAYANGDDMITVNTLKRGEAVLTPEQSEQFKKLVQNLDKAELALTLPAFTNIAPAAREGGEVTNHFDMSITLPNVKNYDEFLYKMQHDKSFEKMVQAMTVGQAAGKSSLKKYGVRF